MAQPAFTASKIADKCWIGLARRGGQTAGRIKQLGTFETRTEALAAAKVWSEIPQGQPVPAATAKALRA